MEFRHGASREQGGEETCTTVNLLKNTVWGLKSKEEQLKSINDRVCGAGLATVPWTVTDNNTNETEARQTVGNVKSNCRLGKIFRT